MTTKTRPELIGDGNADRNADDAPVIVYSKKDQARMKRMAWPELKL